MKQFFIILLIFIITQNSSFCETFTTENLKPYTTNNKYYGLKDSKDNIVVKQQYKKLIRVGKTAWLIQNKKNKFGIIDCSGSILVQPNYDDFGL